MRPTLPPSQQAFSLVETLVVIAIMSVLAVLTMSSFSSLRSTALTSSGNQLVDVFAMARQNSIAKDAYTAVVIKTQGTGAYSSYCLLELIQPENGTIGSWTTITPWRSLPHGIAFLPTGAALADGNTDTYVSTAVQPPVAFPATINFQGQPINLTATTAAFQIYQPDGTLLGSQTTPIRLPLVEGTVDPTSGNFTYQGSTAAGAKLSYYDLVFVSNTGITKIERQ